MGTPRIQAVVLRGQHDDSQSPRSPQSEAPMPAPGDGGTSVLEIQDPGWSSALEDKKGASKRLVQRLKRRIKDSDVVQKIRHVVHLPGSRRSSSAGSDIDEEGSSSVESDDEVRRGLLVRAQLDRHFQNVQILGCVSYTQLSIDGCWGAEWQPASRCSTICFETVLIFCVQGDDDEILQRLPSRHLQTGDTDAPSEFVEAVAGDSADFRGRSLVVQILMARGVPASDFNGSSDPYW